jgi:hypothetical protein
MFEFKGVCPNRFTVDEEYVLVFPLDMSDADLKFLKGMPEIHSAHVLEEMTPGTCMIMGIDDFNSQIINRQFRGCRILYKRGGFNEMPELRKRHAKAVRTRKSVPRDHKPI